MAVIEVPGKTELSAFAPTARKLIASVRVPASSEYVPRVTVHPPPREAPYQPADDRAGVADLGRPLATWNVASGALIYLQDDPESEQEAPEQSCEYTNDGEEAAHPHGSERRS